MSGCDREWKAARCERLRAVRAQERSNAARKAARYRVLLEHTIEAIQSKQDQQWSGARDELLKKLQTRIAQQGRARAAQSSAKATSEATQRQRAQRQSNHEDTMRMVKSRHRCLVKEIQASRSQTAAAKHDILKRRQAIFKADRIKARKMTDQKMHGSEAHRQWHLLLKETADKREATTACSRVDERFTSVPGADGRRAVLHAVERHFNQGTDGLGTPTEQVVSEACRNSSAERAATSAVLARAEHVAGLRHHRALAECQIATAWPRIESELKNIQTAHTKERLRTLAERQCAGSGARFSQSALERLALQSGTPHRFRSSVSVLTPQRRPVTCATAPPSHLRSAGAHAAEAASVSQWQPVQTGLPPPDVAHAASPEDALEAAFFQQEAHAQPPEVVVSTSPVEQPWSSEHVVVLDDVDSAEASALPAGFFQRQGQCENEHTRTSEVQSSGFCAEDNTPTQGTPEELRQEMHDLSSELGLVRCQP
jgi:hypothetical protein